MAPKKPKKPSKKKVSLPGDVLYRMVSPDGIEYDVPAKKLRIKKLRGWKVVSRKTKK